MGTETLTINLGALEMTSLVASIASLILAIVAIWLAFQFYKFSSRISDKTIKASDGIVSSVTRLEKIFDSLYSGTFSIMKDTVSDMRKHMWPVDSKAVNVVSQETEKKVGDKISELRGGMESEINKLLKKQKITNGKITVLKSELRDVVDKAINRSRKVESEVREESLRDFIIHEIRSLQKIKPKVVAEDLVNRVEDKLHISFDVILNELRKMKKEKIIKWTTKGLNPNTIIELT